MLYDIIRPCGCQTEILPNGGVCREIARCLPEPLTISICERGILIWRAVFEMSFNKEPGKTLPVRTVLC